MVRRYVTADTASATSAHILFQKLNLLLSIVFRTPGRKASANDKYTTKNDYLCKSGSKYHADITIMADNDWKKRLGVVYSTNPDFQYTEASPEEEPTPEPSRQRLIVKIDRRQRAGKQVTLVEGFRGSSDDLAALARKLKTGCGVGGSAKDGVITVQGDLRDKVTALLTSMGYNAKRGN